MREQDNWISARRALAKRIRLRVLDGLHAAGGGHFGGSLSVVEILCSLYSSRSIGSRSAQTDRLILSKGHAVPALYALLIECGLLDRSLESFGKFGRGLEGHPDMLSSPQVHFSTGSLGQGLAIGLGMALVLRTPGRHVWVVLGDGECQEGQVWEAAMLAHRYSVTNLHAIVDMNGAQECGWPDERVTSRHPLPLAVEKWRSFGWECQVIEGHDERSLDDWVNNAAANRQTPTVALARTIKGRGVNAFESDQHGSHCLQLTERQYASARHELEQT